MTNLWPFEIPILIWIQRLSSWLILPMHFFSFLGTEEFFLLILSALYWCVDSAIGLRVAITLLLSNTVNDSLKLLFRGARPYWFDSSIKGLAQESSFGIPSGHAQNSMVVWGTIALGFRKWWLTILCCFAIFLVGFSRMYLGVHWISDVVAGWLIGLFLLWLVARFEKPVVQRWVQKSIGLQILFSAVIALVMIGLGIIWRSTFAGWQPPPAWLENIAANFPDGSITPAPISGSFTLAGLWFGILIGASFMHKAGSYQPPHSPGKKIAAYLIGLAGVLIFWYGLGILFPRSEDLASYSLRFIRYSLVGFWIIFLAPLVFRRMKFSI
jgi:membrane-associated phospholipid phosphatase